MQRAEVCMDNISSTPNTCRMRHVSDLPPGRRLSLYDAASHSAAKCSPCKHGKQSSIWAKPPMVTAKGIQSKQGGSHANATRHSCTQRPLDGDYPSNMPHDRSAVGGERTDCHRKRIPLGEGMENLWTRSDHLAFSDDATYLRV